MTEKQIENVSLVMEDLYRVQDIRSATKSKFIGGIAYVLDNGVKYDRGADDHKQGLHKFFESEDFLSIFEFAELLRSYGFRLGYPTKSYLYDTKALKPIRASSRYPSSLSNRADHAEDFIKLRPHYPIYCAIPIFDKQLNNNPVTKSTLPGTSGVLVCWIGHARKIIRDLRRIRVTDKSFRQRRMSFRLATVDYTH